VRTVRTSHEIDASPEAVWETLVDFPSHARWNPFFASVEGDSVVGGTLRIKARKPDGTAGMGFAPTVLEVEPGRMLRWKGKLFVSGLFDGEHVFELTKLPDGRTQLDHYEHFSGALIPVMGKVLTDTDTEDGFRKFNVALADEVALRAANCAS